MLAGFAVAVARERTADRAAPAPVGGALPAPDAALPAPDAALPSEPRRLAARLTPTMRRLREAVARWDPAGPPPEDVTLLALQHQRMLRLMARERRLGDATLSRLPRDVRGEARDLVLALRHLAAIPRSPGRVPRLRIAGAAPAAELRRHYATAERRFGVRRSPDREATDGSTTSRTARRRVSGHHSGSARSRSRKYALSADFLRWRPSAVIRPRPLLEVHDQDGALRAAGDLVRDAR